MIFSLKYKLQALESFVISESTIHGTFDECVL